MPNLSEGFVETTEEVYCSSPIKPLPRHQLQALIIWPKLWRIFPPQSNLQSRLWSGQGLGGGRKGKCKGSEAQGMCQGTDWPLLPRGLSPTFVGSLETVELNQKGSKVLSAKWLQWRRFSWWLKGSWLRAAVVRTELEDILGGTSLREGWGEWQLKVREFKMHRNFYLLLRNFCSCSEHWLQMVGLFCSSASSAIISLPKFA